VHVHASAGATRFVNYLRSTGILAPVPKVSDPCTELMERFISWLTLHRGSTKSTLTQYRSHITSVLNALGTDPSRYNVGAVRQFVLTHIGSYGTSYAKAAGSKLRMFFRFLAAEGICSPDILNAVPKTANWRLTDLPRYLSADEIEQVVITPDERSRVAIRNRAVILLLARLGLRALDIVALRLSDVDWGNGLIRVMGKGRRESWLPLPQDAGDAVLEYLEKARPPSSDDHLFLKTRAPGGPFTTGSVGHIVQQALDRARVEKPTGVRTHLFRHSFARRLLAQDVPLEGIAAILRHRSIETTAKYAKIDVETLRSVVQEWMGDPEVMPC
jgi:site-specific recombinase XerD